MKFKLVETLEQPFTEMVTLEYDASEICEDEDAGKVSGTVDYMIDASDIMEAVWDFMTEDTQSPPITEDEFEHLSEDDHAYEQYVKNNFDFLFKKYEKEFYKRFESDAREKLYRHWDMYADESPYSQRAEDERDFWRNV